MDERYERLIDSLSGAQETQNRLIEALARKELATKDAAGTPSAVVLHGLGGLFSGAGIERDVVTAHITPEGLGSRLRRFPSNTDDPRFSSLTGFTATTGSRPTAICDDATKGYMKSCELTAMFGLNRQDTQEIVMNNMNRVANRGDPMDLVLRGGVLGNTGFSDIGGLNDRQILNRVVMAEMVIAAVNMEREMATDLWTGNIAVGSFPGLDNQITTGQIDARYGTACPALDSDVKSFGYSMVDGTDKDIVEYMSAMEYYIRFNAQRMRLLPVQWAWVMRPQLFFELSAVWPCRYLSNRCTNAAGTSINVINDNVNVELRDAMRNGLFIDVNGTRYPVILDDGIYEYNNINSQNMAVNQFASSIYFVPLTILGGMNVTYMEYYDYRKAQPDVSLLNGLQKFFWTDNGMYTWGISDKKGWCFQLHLATQQRVILRTPQLAGKIMRVSYSPLQHVRSSFPGSPYFEDGGVSQAPAGVRYSVWGTQGGFSR